MDGRGDARLAYPRPTRAAARSNPGARCVSQRPGSVHLECRERHAASQYGCLQHACRQHRDDPVPWADRHRSRPDGMDAPLRAQPEDQSPRRGRASPLLCRRQGCERPLLHGQGVVSEIRCGVRVQVARQRPRYHPGTARMGLRSGVAKPAVPARRGRARTSQRPGMRSGTALPSSGCRRRFCARSRRTRR